MIRFLLDRVQRLWRRLVRRLALRRSNAAGAGAHTGIPLGDVPEPAEYARGLPWLPRGDGRSFNPRDDRILKRLQRRAMYALFAELGQKWVPAEIFRILDREALPSRALEIFCANFGLNVDRVRYRDTEELARLTECIDLLFMVHDIGGRLPPTTRDRLVASIRASEYRAAAQMIDVFRLALRAFDDLLETQRQIPFASFQAFAAFVRGFEDDWLQLSVEDARAALEGCQRYRDLNDRFDRAVSQLDAQVQWVMKYRPSPRRGRNAAARAEDLIATKRAAEREIQSATGWNVTRLEQAIADLEHLVDDFETLIAEINKGGRYGGQTRNEQSADRGSGNGLTTWRWALDVLGFDPGIRPDPAQIRAAFCRQAMRYHPDRNADQADTVQQYYRLRFEEATRAREILDRGVPGTRS